MKYLQFWYIKNHRFSIYYNNQTILQKLTLYLWNLIILVDGPSKKLLQDYLFHWLLKLLNPTLIVQAEIVYKTFANWDTMDDREEVSVNKCVFEEIKYHSKIEVKSNLFRIYSAFNVYI